VEGTETFAEIRHSYYKIRMAHNKQNTKTQIKHSKHKSNTQGTCNPRPNTLNIHGSHIRDTMKNTEHTLDTH